MKESFKEPKEKSFWKETFKKWYFWVISLGWGFWSGMEHLRARSFSEFLGTLAASFFIVIIIFGIIYFIQNSMYRKIEKEVKDKLDKK